MKKLFSLLLVCALAFTMSVSAFAAEAAPSTEKNPRHKLKWMQLHVQQISPLSPLRCPITQRWLIYVKVAVHTPGTTLIPPLAS